jgi:GT2 family glycosyltransferase
MTQLGIVIVNWNTCDLLRRCLASVYASRGVSFEVVVVDNASPDGSAEMVRTEFPQATLIANKENAGYPRANNQGLEALGFGVEEATPPDYALLLNPDTVLPPDGLAEMVAFMEAQPDAGAAGPRLYLEDGSLDLACRRTFPTPDVAIPRFLGLAKAFPNSRRFARYNLTFLDEYETAEVDSVVGAFMLVRGKAIAQVGLLDEQFFMYGEDLDWARRLKAGGWKVYYYPKVEVLHVKRAASRQSPRAQFEFYRAMLLFYRKYDRANTPWYSHLVIMFGLLVKGGFRLLPEVLDEDHKPSQDRVAARNQA